MTAAAQAPRAAEADVDRVGLVVAGAGARGAYEAGALSALLPRMQADGAPPKVLIGTSAGALNVAALACFVDEGWPAATRRVVDIWTSVHLRQMMTPVIPTVVRDVWRYVGQLAGRHDPLPSVFDSRVQVATLKRLLPLERMHENIAAGLVDAVAVAATSVQTGGTVVFVESNGKVPLPPDDAQRNILYVRVERLEVEHLLASAAVPVAFRPVYVSAPATDRSRVDARGWYVDGGVRLNAPLKPAIAMGCRRLGVVATHPGTWPSGPPLPLPDPRHAPDVFRAAAVALRSLMADRMVEDLHTLGLVNELVPTAAPRGGRHREIGFLFAGPPPRAADALGRRADEAYERLTRNWRALCHLNAWALGRSIGGAAQDRGDLLSFLLFEPAFTTPAAALGAGDAQQALDAVPPGLANWLSSLPDARRS